MTGDPDKRLKDLLVKRSFETYEKARQFSRERAEKASKAAAEFLATNGIDPKSILLAAVGSVGRMEALEASDIDLIPVLASKGALESYLPHDVALRDVIAKSLECKVSAGKDLTAPVSISDLENADTIGGSLDDSANLTKRVLILTEGAAAGGQLEYSTVRRRLLDAYANQERTSGRHVLSLCNDLARYYRTLCIEYKAKIDVEDKDWCTRNLKLRHSRKLWYFSTMIAIATLGERCPIGGDEFTKHLADAMARPPVDRLVAAVDGLGVNGPLSYALQAFSWFLIIMSEKKHREQLAKVNHDTRYDPMIENPFPGLKSNSDVLHRELMGLLDALPVGTRQRLFDWFLL